MRIGVIIGVDEIGVVQIVCNFKQCNEIIGLQEFLVTLYWPGLMYISGER